MTAHPTPVSVPYAEDASSPFSSDDRANFGEPAGLAEDTWPGRATSAPEDETTALTLEMLRPLESLHGFRGAIVQDASLHVSLGAIRRDSVDIEATARQSEDVYLTQLHAAHVLGQHWVEEVLTTFESQVHMIHGLRGLGTVFVMLILDRSSANFALARRSLRKICRELEPLHR